MKHCNILTFTFALLFLTSPSFGQSLDVLSIDSLPNKGLLLDKGWKYQTGDNLDWAKPSFDDSAWAKIDPTKEIAALPEVFDANIKWLRFNFEITSDLPKPLGLAINQAGASELYLNGRLFHRFGHFDTVAANVVAYDPCEVAIHIPADTIGRYTLAVRYALQPNIRYTQIFGVTQNRLFNAVIVNLVPTLHTQRAFNLYYSGMEIFIIGIQLLLFVLHLFSYLYNRDNKTQLVLAVYLLAVTLTWALKVIGHNQYSVEDRYFTLNMANSFLGFATVCLLNVVYRMAKTRPDWHYYAMIAFQLVYVAVGWFSYGFPWQTLLLLTCTFYGFFILIRLVRIGMKKSIKGFLPLGVAISFAIFGLTWISSSVLFLDYKVTHYGFNELKFGISPDLVVLVFTVSSIAIPVGLSIFMGIQGSETNKQLSRQLVENEQLKNKAIEQEQEKQHLLSTQNETLEKQVKERTFELNHSLETLKSAQAQLIQAEKLASLGELTAGIAHEIQNPLNFVNNFSELNRELIAEMVEEIEKGNQSEAKAISIALASNEEKINHHGQRASSIVKGMLEHSRASTGVKEPTDLNALADEFLRLAYHGLRAKDNSFNATLETHFDPDLPKIEVIPQDIGRVLLNVINNAFYAVAERSRSTVHQRDVETLHATSLQHPPYQPTVSVSTKRLENAIEIRVEDNGNGIPEAIKDKIFQPFFTTKPTGQGTGLGLSLAYDIVTKGHGGTLTVDSIKGEGTKFTISLPTLP